MRKKSATTILRILQITKTSSYLVEKSLNKFHYLGIVLLTSVFMAVSTHTVAASTTMIITPTPTPTPSITTPNTQLNLETLFRTLLTQELSSADSVVLTTELERILDDLAGGQYQISAEFEDENGEENTEKDFNYYHSSYRSYALLKKRKGNRKMTVVVTLVKMVMMTHQRNRKHMMKSSRSATLLTTYYHAVTCISPAVANTTFDNYCRLLL